MTTISPYEKINEVIETAATKTGLKRWHVIAAIIGNVATSDFHVLAAIIGNVDTLAQLPHHIFTSLQLF